MVKTSKKHRKIAVLFRLLRHAGEHIFDKDAISTGGIVHQNVGYGATELAVLKDGASAHGRVKIGPTNETAEPCNRVYLFFFHTFEHVDVSACHQFTGARDESAQICAEATIFET